MSQRNRRSQRQGGHSQGPRAARERMRLAREKERASNKRLRTIKVLGVVIFVLAVGTLVGISVAVQGKGGSEATDSNPVTVGRAGAPVTLTVWEDFRCPACRQFEDQFRSTIGDLEKQGKLKTQYHLVTLIDGNVGGSGSARAANAALCAEDQDEFPAYHDVLYRNQPPESQDAFADNGRLLALARKVPTLGQSKDFEDCVRQNLQSGRVKRSNAAFEDSGHDSTPTVLLDGKNIFGAGSAPLTPQGLRDMVDKKADKKA